MPEPQDSSPADDDPNPADAATAYSNRSPNQTPGGAGEGETRLNRTVMSAGPPGDPGRAGGAAADGLTGVAQEYELVRELGRGAFGEVWLARKRPSGIEKAVKILHQAADQELALRELRSLELIKNLRHPYLVATEDFWIAHNRLYIVCELAGYSLRGRLKECKEGGLPGVPADELLGYAHEAAEGLDFLHSKMITHRDVKPDNILVLNGHAKVADFGLARQHEGQVEAMSFAGTPAYMAPEVWGGEGGPPSDLYGFVVAYVELRQGFTPFKSGRVMEMMQAHLAGQFDFADFIPEAERAVLRRGMAKEPADRPPSCLAFVEELADVMGRAVMRRSGRTGLPEPRPVPTPAHAPIDTAPPTESVSRTEVLPPPSTGRPVRWITWLMVAAPLAAGVAIALGIWSFTRDRGGNSEATGAAVSREVVVPRGTTPDRDAAVVALATGPRVPEWVVADRGGEKVRFRLIAPVTAGAPRPFYVAESKVWNRLYTGTRPREDVGGPDAPAVHVTANEAAEFAAKFIDGGRLPTPDEWDHAAGFHDRHGLAGPTRAGGQPRVNLPVPAAAHGPSAAVAVNQFGLIDMAGNGREWTAAVLPGRGQPFREVVGAKFAAKDRVVLRGRSYTLATPLTYEVMEYERTEPQTQFADVPSPYTGFRVVLPVP